MPSKIASVRSLGNAMANGQFECDQTSMSTATCLRPFRENQRKCGRKIRFQALARITCQRDKRLDVLPAWSRLPT